MAAEELLLLNLFDSNWFGHKTNNLLQSDQEKMVQESDYYDHRDFSFSVPQNLKVRSQSEQLLDPNRLGSYFSSPSENSLSSPISVLPNQKLLQTIFSGKEAKEILPGEGVKEEEGQEVMNKSERKRRNRASKLGGVTSSKSLSELEFEELKGFMDLGFVFTEEECNDSKLVSMIPGLQRFGKNGSGSGNDYVDHHHHHHRSEDHHDDHKNHDDDCDHVIISRPYLSEAWDVLESERKKKDHIVKPLEIDWKIPALANEIYMKDQLKFWAHSVASTVR